MGLFKRYSNDSNEYVIFSENKRKLEMLLNEDRFISKKWFLGIYNEINEVFNKWWTNKPIRLIINIDQQSTKSNGYYNLHDGLIEELKYGIVNFNYSSLIKPIIYSNLDILISYQDSGKSYVVQAADLLAGTIRKKAIEELDGSRFIYCSSITKRSHKMASSQLGRRTIQYV